MKTLASVIHPTICIEQKEVMGHHAKRDVWFEKREKEVRYTLMLRVLSEECYAKSCLTS